MSRFAMPISFYMSSPVQSIRTVDRLQSAHQRLQELAISSLAVIDNSGALSGVISRTDLLRLGRSQAGAQSDASLLTLPDIAVGEVMTRDVLVVGPDDPIEQACELMVRRSVHRVLVTENSRLIGVFSTRDVMRAVRDQRMNQPIEELMSRPLFTILSHEPVSLATQRLEKAHISGLVVVEDEWPVGVFTQVEALRSRDLSPDLPVEEVMNAAIVCMPPGTRVFRAAEQALAMRVRRIIACRKRDMEGILTGLDFARAAL
jgi:CBS domain-containing protein